MPIYSRSSNDFNYSAKFLATGKLWIPKCENLKRLSLSLFRPEEAENLMEALKEASSLKVLNICFTYSTRNKIAIPNAKYWRKLSLQRLETLTCEHQCPTSNAFQAYLSGFPRIFLTPDYQSLRTFSLSGDFKLSQYLMHRLHLSRVENLTITINGFSDWDLLKIMKGILRSHRLQNNLRYLHIGSPKYAPDINEEAKSKYCSAMQAMKNLKCMRIHIEALI
jgi:hypothetical protein